MNRHLGRRNLEHPAPKSVRVGPRELSLSEPRQRISRKEMWLERSLLAGIRARVLRRADGR